ncbi:hypothetical protein SynMVIR181_00730 [Synechococcus sp. MVIR-18-1]|nr:hypothetical protein SynMVIR181_00730 [Synechococcus sp. MVIR-18-1]
MRAQSSRGRINKDTTSMPSNRILSESDSSNKFQNLSNNGEQHSAKTLAYVLVDRPQTRQKQKLAMN